MSPLELLRPHHWAAVRANVSDDLRPFCATDGWQHAAVDQLAAMTAQLDAAQDFYSATCTARRAFAAHVAGKIATYVAAGWPGHPRESGWAYVSVEVSR